MIAVYDPILGMQKAFDIGYTRMNLVNANAIVAVNIGLQVRDEGNGISAYDYSLSLMSSPATDLVCDTSSAETYKWPCHMSLFVQIPNFDRSIITTEKSMTWMVSSSYHWNSTADSANPGCCICRRRIFFFLTVLELDNFCAGLVTAMMSELKTF